MPKERIDSASGRLKQVELSWFPGPPGRVYLATVNLDRNSQIGESADGLGFLGYEVTLDQAGINSLIRSLTEARDSVYGRDEMSYDPDQARQDMKRISERLTQFFAKRRKRDMLPPRAEHR